MKLHKALVFSACLITPLSLIGCGYQLRGYSPKNIQSIQKLNRAGMPSQRTDYRVILEFNDNRTAKFVKRPLQRDLEALGIRVQNRNFLSDTSNSRPYQSQLPFPSNSANIQVDNIKFRKYDLIGVLTEVRLVIQADVTYQVPRGVGADRRIVTHRQPIEIERSYQYNQASVSAEDQQGDQIKQWLYESLARRITDQYVALTSN